MIRTLLTLFVFLGLGGAAFADQVFTVETGVAGAIVCSGTQTQPARYGAMKADAEGRAALLFPTLDSDLQTINRYWVRIDTPQGGAEIELSPDDLADWIAPQLDPSLQVRCGAAPEAAEDALAVDARVALRRLRLDGWPYGISEPAFSLPLSIRLIEAREADALTPALLCPSDDQACLTNAAAARHQACCDRVPDGYACQEGARARACRAEHEAIQDRHATLFRWANAANAPRCAPEGTVLPQDDINSCCADRYRALTEAEAVLMFSALSAMEGDARVDWTELFVCDPAGNRYNLGP